MDTPAFGSGSAALVLSVPLPPAVGRMGGALQVVRVMFPTPNNTQSLPPVT